MTTIKIIIFVLQIKISCELNFVQISPWPFLAVQGLNLANLFLPALFNGWNILLSSEHKI